MPSPVEIATRVSPRDAGAPFPSRDAFSSCIEHAQIRLTEPSFCLVCVSRAVAHRIDAADLERIEPEPLGADIEMGFGRELRLQRAERTEGAGRRVVGVDADRYRPAGSGMS